MTEVRNLYRVVLINGYGGNQHFIVDCGSSKGYKITASLRGYCRRADNTAQFGRYIFNHKSVLVPISSYFTNTLNLYDD